MTSHPFHRFLLDLTQGDPRFRGGVPAPLPLKWRAQLTRLLECKTEADQKRAIRELLTSGEEIGPPAAKMIDRLCFCPTGRPKKNGFLFAVAAVASFALKGHDKLRGRKRDRAIKSACEAAGCSRDEFRKHYWMVEHFRAWQAGKPLPPTEDWVPSGHIVHVMPEGWKPPED